MTCNNNPINSGCLSKDGCPPGVCPDFTIRRHDTKPVFKVSVSDCDGPLDLTDLILEVNMWAKAKLKTAITTESTYLSFADAIGFEQVMVGDVIVMDRVRLPEYMLVTAFDEDDKLIQVQRGYNDTTPSSWKKGTALRIFRIMNGVGATEMLKEDITQIDGTVLEDELTESYLTYEWSAEDTCMPGCFWLEFKLLKESDDVEVSMTATDESEISFTDPNFTSNSFHCGMAPGIEWVRRFPVSGEGFLIKIVGSPSAEL